MSPRRRRLIADQQQMQDLAFADRRFSFRGEGDPADEYHLMLSVPGIARLGDGSLRLRSVHRCVAYLHLDYPRRPPQLTWLTPIFHPNILGPERNGGVCIGLWSASESLADLVKRLASLVSYASFNTDDALDHDAAAWVRAAGMRPGEPLDGLIARSGAGRDALDFDLRPARGWS